MADRIDLKRALMEVGNRLVTERGYNPGPPAWSPKSTLPITEFTRWLNNQPEAQEILAEWGIDWPIVR